MFYMQKKTVQIMGAVGGGGNPSPPPPRMHEEFGSPKILI